MMFSSSPICFFVFIAEGLPLDSEMASRVEASRHNVVFVGDFVPLRFSHRPPRPIDAVPQHEQFASTDMFMEVYKPFFIHQESNSS